MKSKLHEYLARDHERLDELLDRCVNPDGSVVAADYAEFRLGLLRHIAIEERVLFPEMRKVRGHQSELEVQLHRDHAALSALLVPPPDAAVIGRIRSILTSHNPLEEGEGGLYEQMDLSVVGEELMERARSVPQVRVAPHTDTPTVRYAIEQLVREADDGRKSLQTMVRSQAER